MSGLTKEEYEHQKAECEGLCDIHPGHDKIAEDDPNVMRCVTCPFCKQTVDAILTDATISCPACKVSVTR